MSTGGKAALGTASSAGATDRARSAPAKTQSAPARTQSAPVRAAASTAPGSSARSASLARRKAMSTAGKAAVQSADRIRTVTAGKQQPAAQKVETAAASAPATTAAPAPMRKPVMGNTPKVNVKHSAGRAASLARRKVMSSRGKAGIGKNGMTAAQTTRASNPGLSSRELAKVLREERSKNGKTGKCNSRPCGHVRKKAGDDTGAAADQPWKVGASETTRGQIVTGTMVGRSPDVTGDEPSTCRGITGTEYLGADIFRSFCQSDPSGTPAKVKVTKTSHGNRVSGNPIGRGTNVTGNESGTCKRVTGNEYISAEESQGYCGEFMGKSPRKVLQSGTAKGMTMTGTNVSRSEKVTGDEYGMKRSLTGTQYKQPEDIGKAPSKVGVSKTLRGGSVTGTTVGRHENMTGDEPGSCKNITGDDYVGQEQYGGFCKSAPQPQDRKVGVSGTLKGMIVTGTMTGRSGNVTGDEPGSCKAVTGTPYAGADQFGGFCSADDAGIAAARTRPMRSTPGPSMTGLQPGVGGKMTGDRKGACEPVSGTPYVGADQFANVCPSTPADTASPDFPQAMGAEPWQQFSVQSPSGGAQRALGSTGVTGNQYEQGHITGPFGMATGKVTGTEEARFGQDTLKAGNIRPVVAEEFEGRIKSRITGEGQDAGLKITGDDWELGGRTTGTEGISATVRNPTERMGPSHAMAVTQKRNEELPKPNSKVTGGSGNTEKGSLITYSGGARG